MRVRFVSSPGTVRRSDASDWKSTFLKTEPSSAWSALADHPELAPYRPFTLFAVGQDYVSPDHRLRPDDELCLFPPVSGGAAPDVYRVVMADPLSPDSIAAQVDDRARAASSSSGVVRNGTGGRP